MGIPFISARACPVTSYQSKVNDEDIFFITARGNDDLVEKYRNLIGESSVVPGCELNFFKFLPQFDSCGNIKGT